jgi:hypothetical protein
MATGNISIAAIQSQVAANAVNQDAVDAVTAQFGMPCVIVMNKSRVVLGYVSFDADGHFAYGDVMRILSAAGANATNSILLQSTGHAVLP